jgi:hypothetical protein
LRRAVALEALATTRRLRTQLKTTIPERYKGITRPPRPNVHPRHGRRPPLDDTLFVHRYDGAVSPIENELREGRRHARHYPAMTASWLRCAR